MPTIPYDYPKLIPLVEARELARKWGFSSLLTLPSANAKLSKSEAYFNAGITLAQGDLSGHEVCAGRGACFRFRGMNPCLGNWGRSETDPGMILNARINRTRCLFEAPDEFDLILRAELEAIDRKAQRLKLPVAFRPNILSDYPWDSSPQWWIFDRFKHWAFYGYTKIKGLYRQYLRNELPANYHLTMSYSERLTDDYCREILEKAGTLAIPFATKSIDQLPRTFLGFPVIDGVSSDLRFLDPMQSVVGLTAKAPRNKQSRQAFLRVVTQSGFFVDPSDPRCR